MYLQKMELNVDTKLFEPYIDMLDALYVSEDAEEDMRTLSKSNNDIWYHIALSPEVGYDLRGVAAKVYTLGLLDKNDEKGAIRSDLESLKTLRDTSERLVKLGVLYAMEAMDNYDYAFIFHKDSDTYVLRQYRELTGLMTEFQTTLPQGFPPSYIPTAEVQRNFLALAEPPEVKVHYMNFEGEEE